MTLHESAWAMVTQALEVYRDSPRAASWLHRHLARLSEPLRVAVAGPPASGKSTLLNAIVGDRITPEADRLLVDWPGEVLLIDTPALGDDGTAPTPEATFAETDAVLYLMPDPNSPDLRFLRAAHDNPISRAHPVHTLVVLSRADELGGGRVDGLVSARQVAARHAKDSNLRELCQDVHAVAGLVAYAGGTLRESEVDGLTALSRLPRKDLDAALLSADRFTEATLPRSVRAGDLLQRLGIFGVRLGVTLVRRGFDSVNRLSAELVRASGLDDLRESVGRCFVDRAPALKARSALIGVEVVLRMEPRPGSAPLAAELERVLAGAHDFREMRLIAALRTGRVALPDAEAEQALRLVGGFGTGFTARLGVGEGPGAERAVYDALHRWRVIAEDLALGVAERRAAAVVVRTCEALSAAPRVPSGR